MTRVGGDGAGCSLSMAWLDSHAKGKNLPLTSGFFWGEVIFRCALKKISVGGPADFLEAPDPLESCFGDSMPLGWWSKAAYTSP